MANMANMADMAEYLLDDEDLLLWTYGGQNKTYLKGFDLSTLSSEDCKALFRFEKEHIPLLRAELGLPIELKGDNGCAFSGEEGLCVLLRRLAYPNRLSDLTYLFERSSVELSLMFNKTLSFVHEENSNLLKNLNQAWLSHANLDSFAQSISDAGAPLTNCWGFIDGTVRPICRPSLHQRIVFNGHKRVHGLKFQIVSTPNGMIANLFGPMEGKRHDSGMLRESGLLQQLDVAMTKPDGHVYSLYGDPAYPLRPHLLAPFRGAALTDEEEQFNKRMSSVRVTVEWLFGKILSNFAFVDYKKNQKLYLQPVGKYYDVAALLTNCHTCLYGSEVGEFFGLQPPSLHEYLHG